MAKTKSKPLFECQNCSKRWPEGKLREVKDFSMRTEPGEPIPAGECPDCGAVCHVVGLDCATKFDAQEAATVLAALAFYADRGMGEPDNRHAKIHEIACGETLRQEVISLDEKGVRQLSRRLTERWRI